ncbi:MAG: glycosyltransferase family 4 protein [Muribaculaceae bacterium]|nr:glycosyltransferase family 4 protein [Muribaculaceae bacterium]
MNVGFDGHWAVFNHTSRGNLSRSVISAIATYKPKNKYIIYGSVASENRHLTPLLANPSVMMRQPKHGYFKTLWRWGDGFGKDLQRHHVRIYHGLCGVLPFFKGKSRAHMVVSITDLDARYNAKELGFWKSLKEKMALSHSIKMAERIVVPSEWAKNLLHELYNVDFDRIDIVPPCVDKGFSTPVHDEARQSLAAHYGLPKRFVLLMGPLKKSKNLLDMVKAIRRLKDKELCIVMVGKSTNYYRHSIRPYVNEYNLHDRVIHVKHLHSADLPNIYQQATAVLCPTQNELYSLSMLEAMSCGIPVMVNPDSMMATEAGDAVMVTTGSTPEAWAAAIDALVASPEQQQIFAERGRNYVAKFTPEATAEALQACYDKIED